MRGIKNPMYFFSTQNLTIRVVLGVMLPLFIFAFFLIPQTANAGKCIDIWLIGDPCDLAINFFQEIGVFLLSIILGTVVWILNALSFFLLFLANAVLKTTMSFVMSASYTPLTAGATSGLMVGWILVRDIANSFLVFVLIAIGVGTMLNLRIRGAAIDAKLLVPFAIIALLINFSPLLTGIVIDISNILTKFFFDEAVKGPNHFLNNNPFSIEELPKITTNAEEMIIYVLTSIIGIFFNLILTFTFFLVSILLLVRVFFLQILVILSPIYFLMYILPQTRSQFKWWWNQFLQWSIIAIPMGFFLWLAAQMLSAGINCDIEDVGEEGATGAAGYANIFLEDGMFCELSLSFFALFIIWFGMLVSFQTSAQGANMIIGRATAVRKGIQRQTTARARREVKEKVTAPAAGAVGRWAYTAPIAKSRFLGAGHRALGRQGITYQKQAKAEEQKRAAREMAPLDYDQLQIHALSGPTAESAEAIARMNNLKPERLSKDIEQNEKLKERINALEKVAETNEAIKKQLKDIFERNPHIAEDKQKAIQGMDAKNIWKMSAQAWEDKEIVQELLNQNKITASTIQNIARDEKKLEAFEKVLHKMFGEEETIDDIIFQLTQPKHVFDTADKKRAWASSNKLAYTFSQNPHAAAALRGLRGERGTPPPPPPPGPTPPPAGSSRPTPAPRTPTGPRRARKPFPPSSPEDRRHQEDVEGAKRRYEQDVAGAARRRAEDIAKGRNVPPSSPIPKPNVPPPGGVTTPSGQRPPPPAGFRPEPTPRPRTESTRERRPFPPAPSGQETPPVAPRREAPKETAPPSHPPSWLASALETMNEGGVPGMITNRLRQYLQEEGAAKDEIRNMTPEQAWRKAEELSTKKQDNTPPPATPANEEVVNAMREIRQEIRDVTGSTKDSLENMLDQMERGGADITESLEQIRDTIRDDIGTPTRNAMSDVLDEMAAGGTNMREGLTSLRDQISTIGGATQDTLQDIANNMEGRIEDQEDISDEIEQLRDAIQDNAEESTRNNIHDLLDRIERET